MHTAAAVSQAYSPASQPRSTSRRRAIQAGLTIAARILLGLIFVLAGTSGFLLIHNPPPAPPGLAATFQDVFFRSCWVLFVDGFELLGGALLLANRFVPLALVVLAGLVTNIFIYHLTMMPQLLAAPVVLSGLWFAVAWPLRAHFAPLLTAKS